MSGVSHPVPVMVTACLVKKVDLELDVRILAARPKWREDAAGAHDSRLSGIVRRALTNPFVTRADYRDQAVARARLDGLDTRCSGAAHRHDRAGCVRHDPVYS
jgi:hypothetical protein